MSLFLILLLQLQLWSPLRTWHVDYVGQQILVPMAGLTEELLYCICEQCQDEPLDQLLRWVQQATMHPQLVISQDINLELRHGNHKRNTYGVVLARSPNDRVFQLHEKLLRGRHYYLNLVIMSESVERFELIEQVLRRLQRGKFINTDVYYYNATSARHEFFSYTYYPHFVIVNKTHWVPDIISKTIAVLRERINMAGYELSTPIQQDALNVIKIKDRYGVARVEGTSYNILKNFASTINFQLKPYNDSSYSQKFVDMRRVLNLLRTGKIKLSAHAYALFEIQPDIDKSYPLLVVNWCLMVPIVERISSWLFPLLPFECNVWLLVIGVFVFQNFINYLWLKQHRLQLRNFVLKNLCQHFNITPPFAIKSGNCWLQMLINACSFLYGLLLSTFYTSMLGSILTITLSRFEINCMQDLITCHLPVLIIDYELEFLLKSGIDLHADFLALLQPVNSTYFFQHQLALDTTYAYFVTDLQWRFLNLQQQHLRKRVFKFSNICFGAYHLAFPMEPDSPIWRELEYYLYRIHSSGLYFYYESKAFDYAISAGLLRRLTDSREFEAIGMPNLSIVFVAHAFNLLLASVVFCIEHLAHR